MNLNKTIGTGVGWSVEIHPGPKMGINQLQDHYLGLADSNSMLDYGDNSQPVLLVSQGRQRRVGYEFLPEVSPPGATIEQLAAELRQAGVNVVGINQDRTYVIAVEDF